MPAGDMVGVQQWVGKGKIQRCLRSAIKQAMSIKLYTAVGHFLHDLDFANVYMACPACFALCLSLLSFYGFCLQSRKLFFVAFDSLSSCNFNHLTYKTMWLQIVNLIFTSCLKKQMFESRPDMV